MSKTTIRCPNVTPKIEEAASLDAAGKCWCDCLKTDVPNARKLASEGKCGAANSVIEAALKRCDRGGVQNLRERAMKVKSFKPLPSYAKAMGG